MTTEMEYLERLSVLEKKKAVLLSALDNIRLEESKIRKEFADKFENPTQYIGKKFKTGNETYQVTKVHCISYTGQYSIVYHRIKKDGVSLSMRCFSMDFKSFINRMRHENDPSRKIVLV